MSNEGGTTFRIPQLITLLIIPFIIVILIAKSSFFFDVVASAAGCADYCFTCELVGDGYCTGILSSYGFGSLFIVLGLSVVEIILVTRAIWNRIKNKNIKPRQLTKFVIIITIVSLSIFVSSQINPYSIIRYSQLVVISLLPAMAVVSFVALTALITKRIDHLGTINACLISLTIGLHWPEFLESLGSTVVGISLGVVWAFIQIKFNKHLAKQNVGRASLE